MKKAFLMILETWGFAVHAEPVELSLTHAAVITPLAHLAKARSVSRRITGSITQLIAFSRRVAAGDFSARAQHGRADEFGILASAVNQMAESTENSNGYGLRGVIRIP